MFPLLSDVPGDFHSNESLESTMMVKRNSRGSRSMKTLQTSTASCNQTHRQSAELHNRAKRFSSVMFFFVFCDISPPGKYPLKFCRVRWGKASDHLWKKQKTPHTIQLQLNVQLYQELLPKMSRYFTHWNSS